MAYIKGTVAYINIVSHTGLLVMALRHFRCAVRSIRTWRLAATECFARYLSYVNDYDRLLKVYGNADGHVAAKRFVKVRITGSYKIDR